jgi:hypothetical protein
MEELCAFMKSSIVHVNFSKSKRGKLLDGIAKVAFDRHGSMGLVRNIAYFFFLCFPSYDISCVVILLVSFQNQYFNYSKGMLWDGMLGQWLNFISGTY